MTPREAWLEVAEDEGKLRALVEEHGSSHSIAVIYGVHPSTVQRRCKNYGIPLTARNQYGTPSEDFNILFLDIETSPNLADVWSLWKQNVGLNQLRESSRMICFAAGYADGKIHFYSEFFHGRDQMLQKMHELMSGAGVLVHYNGNRFDIPTINKEFLLSGYTPPDPSKNIDLYRVVKKHFRFPSYKLEYVAKTLGIGSKVKHEGHELWTKCLAGDKTAWDKMRRYNMQDVALLKDLYWRLLPWITNHPHRGLYQEGAACPNCGSGDVVGDGLARTNTGVFPQHHCRKCGTWFRDSKRLSSVATQAVKF